MGCSASSAALASNVAEGTAFSRAYILDGKIGEGAHAQVRLARSRRAPAGPELAVKILRCPRKSVNAREFDALRQGAERELSLWRSLGQHEHCVWLVDGFLEERGECYMVMEHCESSLSEREAVVRSWGSAELGRVFREMLLAVAHMHELSIVHCDIKSQNFLLGGARGRTVKIGDFGLSVKLPASGKLQGCCGSALYMSPEMIAGKGYDQKTDIWSLGVTGYHLLCNDHPYNPPKNTAAQQLEGVLKRVIGTGRPEPSYSCRNSKRAPQAALSLVRKLLERSQSRRTSATQALQDEFVAVLSDDSDDCCGDSGCSSISTCTGASTGSFNS